MIQQDLSERNTTDRWASRAQGTDAHVSKARYDILCVFNVISRGWHSGKAHMRVDQNATNELTNPLS